MTGRSITTIRAILARAAGTGGRPAPRASGWATPGAPAGIRPRGLAEGRPGGGRRGGGDRHAGLRGPHPVADVSESADAVIAPAGGPARHEAPPIRAGRSWPQASSCASTGRIPARRRSPTGPSTAAGCSASPRSSTRRSSGRPRRPRSPRRDSLRAEIPDEVYVDYRRGPRPQPCRQPGDARMGRRGVFDYLLLPAGRHGGLRLERRRGSQHSGAYPLPRSWRPGHHLPRRRRDWLPPARALRLQAGGVRPQDLAPVLRGDGPVCRDGLRGPAFR